MQTPTSSSSLLNSSSLAALLVGSEAGTTDAGSGYDEVGKPTYRASIEGGGDSAPTITTAAGTLTTPPNNSRNGHGRERSGEVEVQERYKRFREKGDFTADDDDPVGRPWGRFDSNIEREREREGERDAEREEGGGGGGGVGGGNGVMPLRLPIKNPDPNRVVRGAGAG